MAKFLLSSSLFSKSTTLADKYKKPLLETLKSSLSLSLSLNVPFEQIDFRIHHDDSIDLELLEVCKKHNWQLVLHPRNRGWEGTMWRFLDIFDQEYDYVCVYDTDRPLNELFKYCCNLAISKNNGLVAVQPYSKVYYRHINADLFIVQPRFFKNHFHVLADLKHILTLEQPFWGVDEIWLDLEIYPIIRDSYHTIRPHKPWVYFQPIKNHIIRNIENDY